MNLEDIISKKNQDCSLIRTLEEDLKHNEFNLDDLGKYPVGSDEIDNISIDSETLFSDLLNTKINLLHQINMYHNPELFQDLSNSMVPNNGHTGLDLTTDIVKKMIRFIIIHQILFNRESRSCQNMKCLYCDSALRKDDTKCPVCEADIKGCKNDDRPLECFYCQSLLEKNQTICPICKADRNNVLDIVNGTMPRKEIKANMAIPKGQRQWNCEYCAVSNKNDISYCGICNGLAPFVKNWKCGLCSTTNQKSAPDCSNCHEKRNNDIEFEYESDYFSNSKEGKGSFSVNGDKSVGMMFPNIELSGMSHQGHTSTICALGARSSSCSECRVCSKGEPLKFNRGEALWKVCSPCNSLLIKIRFDELGIGEYSQEDIVAGVELLLGSISKLKGPKHIVNLDEEDCRLSSLDLTSTLDERPSHKVNETMFDGLMSVPNDDPGINFHEFDNSSTNNQNKCDRANILKDRNHSKALHHDQSHDSDYLRSNNSNNSHGNLLSDSVIVNDTYGRWEPYVATREPFNRAISYNGESSSNEILDGGLKTKSYQNLLPDSDFGKERSVSNGNKNANKYPKTPLSCLVDDKFSGRNISDINDVAVEHDWCIVSPDYNEQTKSLYEERLTSSLIPYSGVQTNLERCENYSGSEFERVTSGKNEYNSQNGSLHCSNRDIPHKTSEMEPSENNISTQFNGIIPIHFCQMGSNNEEKRTLDLLGDCLYFVTNRNDSSSCVDGSVVASISLDGDLNSYPTLDKHPES